MWAEAVPLLVLEDPFIQALLGLLTVVILLLVGLKNSLFILLRVLPGPLL